VTPAGAVVLAGGGEIGIAWETGLAAGLLDEGVDLRRAGLIVGTSAGSVVGSRLAAGVDPRTIADAIIARAPNPKPAGPLASDELREQVRSAFADIMQRWIRGEAGGQTLAEVGRFAETASPISEADFRDGLAERLRIAPEFPDGMAVTAIDTGTGELEVFDSASGIALADAVAASCSVPGLFPPVTIDGHRYMDGGARSVTNADVALRAEPGPALIVTLLPGQAPSGSLFDTWERRLAREVKQLEEAGFATHLLRATPEELQIMGFNAMDSSKAPPSAEAGRSRGRAEASDPAFDAWRA
jgi:NTE family protein